MLFLLFNSSEQPSLWFVSHDSVKAWAPGTQGLPREGRGRENKFICIYFAFKKFNQEFV